MKYAKLWFHTDCVGVSSVHEHWYCTGAYLSCLLVAWKLPQHLKGGGAHRKSASTAPTNNPRVAARYYSAYRPTVPVSSSVQLGASRKVVSDRESVRATTIAAVIPGTNCQYGRSFIYSWAWFNFSSRALPVDVVRSWVRSCCNSYKSTS